MSNPISLLLHLLPVLSSALSTQNEPGAASQSDGNNLFQSLLDQQLDADTGDDPDALLALASDDKSGDSSDDDAGTGEEAASLLNFPGLLPAPLPMPQPLPAPLPLSNAADDAAAKALVNTVSTAMPAAPATSEIGLAEVGDGAVDEAATGVTAPAGTEATSPVDVSGEADAAVASATNPASAAAEGGKFLPADNASAGEPLPGLAVPAESSPAVSMQAAVDNLLVQQTDTPSAAADSGLRLGQLMVGQLADSGRGAGAGKPDVTDKSRQAGFERLMPITTGYGGDTSVLPGVAVRGVRDIADNPATTQDSVTDTIANPAAAGVRATVPAATQTPTSVAVAQNLNLPMAHPQWSEALAARVVWFGNHDIQEAKIQLTPADLGPIDIKVAVSNGEANVAFNAHHAATRDAIEQSLPRLRDMFAQQGVQLGQVNVSSHGDRNTQGFGQERFGQPSASTTGPRSDAVNEEVLEVAPRRIAATERAVDYYV